VLAVTVLGSGIAALDATVAETLRKWVGQAGVDAGSRPA
jgi:hypothetical protein